MAVKKSSSTKLKEARKKQIAKQNKIINRGLGENLTKSETRRLASGITDRILGKAEGKFGIQTSLRGRKKILKTAKSAITRTSKKKKK